MIYRCHPFSFVILGWANIEGKGKGLSLVVRLQEQRVYLGLLGVGGRRSSRQGGMSRLRTHLATHAPYSFS